MITLDPAAATIVAGTHELSGHADLRLSDGASLEVGTMRFVVLATPGHTPESVSYAAYPESAKQQCWGVFTGDALFVGATGRVDLGGAERTRDSAGACSTPFTGKSRRWATRR